MRLLPVLPLLALLAACSGTADRSAEVDRPPSPTGTPGPSSDLTVPALAALLLQDEDVPQLSLSRPYAEPELVTRSTPQLALCRPESAVAPHAVANVLGRPSAADAASIFQVVSVYADEPAARAAHEDAVGRARACGAFESAGGARVTVTGLQPLTVPAPARAVQYELVADGRTDREARTLVQSGRFTVLLTSLGTATAGATLPQLQAQVLPKALARLRP